MTSPRDALIAELRASLAIERARVDTLTQALLLASTVKQVAATVEIEAPDVPPDAVLAAMKRISPIKDPAYEANWAYWEANKEKARLHPDAFADEILTGAVYDQGGGAEV